MLERIGEGSDGLATVFPAMLNSLIALRALGYSKTNPIYAKAEKDFAKLFVDDPEDFRIQPCLSPVWDTAITIISLAESGLPSEHPALQKAADWLVNKEVRIRGDWSANNSLYPNSRSMRAAASYSRSSASKPRRWFASTVSKPSSCNR